MFILYTFFSLFLSLKQYNKWLRAIRLDLNKNNFYKYKKYLNFPCKKSWIIYNANKVLKKFCYMSWHNQQRFTQHSVLLIYLFVIGYALSLIFFILYFIKERKYWKYNVKYPHVNKIKFDFPSFIYFFFFNEFFFFQFYTILKKLFFLILFIWSHA
jgi:hypothetical protein